MLRSVSCLLSTCSHRVRVTSYGTKFQLQSHIYHKSSEFCSRADKEFAGSNQPVPGQILNSSDTDNLHEQLRKSKFILPLMKLISQHLDIMDNKHIVTSFEVIHDNFKQRGSLQGKSEELVNLPHNETFQALCIHTLNRIRYMEPSDVIAVYNTLSLLGIRTNTYIMQSVSKMLRTKIHDLSLSELSFLNFTVSRHKLNSDAYELKMALPFVIETHIKKQLDSDNVHEIVGCLKVCSETRLKPTTLQKIVSALLKKTDVLTGEQATTVIVGLLNLDAPLDGYSELLNTAFHVAVNGIEQLKVDEILHIVRMCCKFNFFHGDFFVASAKKAVLERWNLGDCYELQKHLHCLSFFHHELLDLLCEHIVSNSEGVRTDSKYSLLHIASYFALADYHPPGLQKVLEVLCASDEKLSTMYETLPHLYIKFASFLSVLGHFPEEIFQHVFNESFFTKALSVTRKRGGFLEFEKSICSLLWSIQAHEQCSRFCVPSSVKEQVLQSVIDKNLKSSKYPLIPYLESGLGGSQFFCTGIFTHCGHAIHHAVAVRKGNILLSLSNLNDGLSGLQPPQQVTYIEDLYVPSDAKMVTIIVTDEDSYYREPSILRSFDKMKCLSLRKMNYCPVLINYPTWCKLPDCEKIPYLIQEIKQVIEDNELSRSNLP